MPSLAIAAPLAPSRLPNFRLAAAVMLVAAASAAPAAAPAGPFDAATLVALLGFAAAMSFTPGPNNLMVMASAATFGLRRTAPHILGVATGFPLMVVGVGLGLAGVFAAAPALHGVVKAVGAVYLLYLAWLIATAERPEGGEAPAARPLGFWRAALFQWVNPKGWVAALGAVAAYTSVGGSFAAEVGVIALAFGLMALPSLAIWAAFGAAIGRWLATPARLRAFNWSVAALLVLSIVPLLG